MTCPTTDARVPSDMEPVVDWSEVLSLTRAKRSTIRAWMRDGRFPRPIEGWPGLRTVWRRSDIRAYFARFAAPQK